MQDIMLFFDKYKRAEHYSADSFQQQSALMIQDLLNSIGLSEKESRMYIALLRSGTQTTSYLAKKAGLNRGTAFGILHELLKKGLVIKSTKKKIQYFSALDPQQLVNYIDHQQKSLEDKKEQLLAHMSQFVAITNPHTSKPQLELFDGAEGGRTVYESILKSEERTIRSFLSIGDVVEFLGPKFIHDVTKKRIDAGYQLDVIRTLEKDKQGFDLDKRLKKYGQSKKQRRNVRYAPEDLAFPMTMFLYDNKIAVVSSKEESFGAIIESREMCDMLKKLFEILWVSLERKKR